jgi:hypothetical protein
MANLRGSRPGRDLPKPSLAAALLGTFAVLVWLVGLTGLVVAVVAAASGRQDWPLWLLGGLTHFSVCLLLGAGALGLALAVKYAFSAATSAALSERCLRDFLEKREEDQTGTGLGGTASHEEVVSLLAEIMENTLLDDPEKAAKRPLAKKHRQQALRREIEALTGAARYREARQRLEEFRLRYADSPQVAELEERLAQALAEHERSEITHISEQVERYMGLGLWDRARNMAENLARQYPENPEATRLSETVRRERQAHRREEQQRLYREIEHLASRRHWREALQAADLLLKNHPDSPEAHALRDQVEELRRNAAILERREWEARIAEHVGAGRHREAYDLAVQLMEKYPDSPQADAIRQRLDQLRLRAGIEEG